MLQQEAYYDYNMLREAKKKVKAMRTTVPIKAHYKTLVLEYKALLDELYSINKYIFNAQYHYEYNNFKNMVWNDYKNTTKKRMEAYAKYLKRAIYRELIMMEEYAK